MATYQRFKITLLGDADIGKTSYIMRHITGYFTRDYVPTLGFTTHALSFNTTRGRITFDVWDTAGQNRFGGLRDGYTIGSDGAIIMFDVCSENTYHHVPKWINDVKKNAPNAKLVICGNRCDLINFRVIKPENIDVHLLNNCNYYDISAKSNYNFEKPFLDLARQLMNDPNLTFIP